MTKKLRVVSAYAVTLLCLFIIFANIYGKYKDGVPNVMGYKVNFIPTDSMAPTIKAGSFVLSTSKTEEIRIGDIVTYIPDDKSLPALTHRVVDIDKSGRYIIKGDNLPEPDAAPVHGEQIIYKTVLY